MLDPALSHQASLTAAAAFILILGIVFIAGRRRYRALTAIQPGKRANRGAVTDCMVVIPARNEEASIGRAVSSLPADTVIVVDDHSTDRTAARAHEAGAGVLTAPKLPPNAVGKANACAFGAAALNSRWVLFTDADTWFEPGFLEAAVNYAEASGLALLSIHLDPEYRGFAENVLAPYARALAFAGLSSSREPNGLFRSQCLLARAAGLGHIRLYQGYKGIRPGFSGRPSASCRSIPQLARRSWRRLWPRRCGCRWTAGCCRAITGLRRGL